MGSTTESPRACDVLVVGGGAAGLSAAVAAAKAGAHVLVVEREHELGGILQQCIHNGFGLHRFGEELTGPEFASRDIREVEASDLIDVELDTSVVSLAAGPDGGHVATISGPRVGYTRVACGAVVLACGCRERNRGNINIAGTRPAGVWTAGTAQKLVNCDGALVGREVVILGSGDIGLIMARRMTWEGAHVICVCELASEPGGLRRNIAQCLDDNGIPLYLSTTVTQIFGSPRLTAVELSEVDPKTFAPIPGTQRIVECDTLLLSVGLIPENAVAETAGVEIDRATSGPSVDERYQTSVPGIFVAGNELHVHDLADYVSEEGAEAGRAAAEHALAGNGAQASPEGAIVVSAGECVGSITPQRISFDADAAVVRLRSRARIEGAELVVSCGDQVIRRLKRQIVVPSEMQTIKLRPAELDQVRGLVGADGVARVSVSCVEAKRGGVA